MSYTVYRDQACAFILAAALLALPAAVVSAGTTSAGTTSDGAADDRQTSDFQELRQEWGEAIDTLQGYSVRQRDQAMAAAGDTLAAMDRRIERLEARAGEQWSELSRETREQRHAALRSLRQQRNRLAEWYGGMRHGSAGAWEEVKGGFVSAYDRLADAMGRAVAEFESEAEEQ